MAASPAASVDAAAVQRVCLICIDGWGITDSATPGNAVSHAKTPVMTKLAAEAQYTTLAAHGLAVGLPDGLMGNSEVGHLNIGAGRIVYQDIVRIDLSVQTGAIRTSKAVVDAFANAKAKNGRLHFLGLVSDGGVHSHIRHLFALLDAAKAAGVPKAFVHFFADGRDTGPSTSDGFAKDLLDHLDQIQYGSLATIVGRYYAMDRDTRWERIKVAYEALVKGTGEASSDAIATIKARYAKSQNDEFLEPIILNNDGIIQDNDTLVFFDFRSDRMRELVETIGFPAKHFETDTVRQGLHITTLTQYKASFPFPVIFPQQSMDNVLADWLAKLKLPQYHVAETEKYAHVTFFFNGGTEKEYALEQRKMVPSPKVATYDLQPTMSSHAVAEEVAAGIAQEHFPLVMCNFAPPDMVGHTGVYEAALKAVEATDAGIGIIYDACIKHNTILFVTADHGNAEQMLSPTGGPHTAHTCNPVPFVMAYPPGHANKRTFSGATDGKLCDVAPTVLAAMGLPIPPEMDGHFLLA